MTLKYTYWVLLFPFVFISCATPKPQNGEIESNNVGNIVNQRHLASENLKTISPPELIWNLKVEGLISDVNIDRMGKYILASSIPDLDREYGNEHLLHLIKNSGSRIFQKKLKGPTKFQALSENAERVLVANYFNEILGFNEKGKQIFVIESSCRPFPLSQVKKILCFNEDDADPLLMMSLYTWEGKKIKDFSIEKNNRSEYGESLLFKVSDDEKRVGVSFSRGVLLVFDITNDNVVPRNKIMHLGKILDFHLSSSSLIQSAVLTTENNFSDKRFFVAFDGFGNKKIHQPIKVRAEQIERVAAENRYWLYGNGSEGQVFGILQIAPDSGRAELLWTQNNSRPAEFPFSLVSASSYAIMGGFINSSKLSSGNGTNKNIPSSSQKEIFSIDQMGTQKWKLALSEILENSKGLPASIYIKEFSSESNVLVLGTDNAQLMGYSIKE